MMIRRSLFGVFAGAAALIASDAGAQVHLGPHRQITILVRYSDIPATPDPTSYYQGLIYSDEFPSANHYFQEVSNGLASIEGDIVGWVNLPRPWSYYNWDLGDDEDTFAELDLGRLRDDAIAAVNSQVFFPGYDGINIVTNADHACDNPELLCAGAQRDVPLFLDGMLRNYDMIYLPPWVHHIQGVIPHETFHALGRTHSGSPVAKGYNSEWDVLSSGGTCVTPHPEYGCLANYTLAWNLYELGWMGPERRYTTGVGSAGIVTIERLALPVNTPGAYTFARMPIDGAPGMFYTAEFRAPAGYDEWGGLPGTALVMHRVDPGSTTHWNATVVDPDGNDDPNDAGAMWMPGETFVSEGIVLHVESMTDGEAVVSVSSKARGQVYVNHSAVFGQVGSAQNPWSSVTEGYASVVPEGRVLVAPGSYDERFRISKPCSIERSGASGVVRIGG